MQLVQAIANKLADIVKKSTGDLAAATVHLFKNDFTPTQNNVLGDFTEADYTGYTNQAIGTWGTPYIDFLQRVLIQAPSLQFSPTGSTVTNTVYGYYIQSAGTGTPLIASARFDTPVSMTDAHSAAFVEPTWILSQAP